MAPPPADERAQFQADRLAFFSDAVFAIAITLLALNIHLPVLHQPSEAALRQAIVQMLPSIVAFALSFLVVSNYWRAHHRLFRWVQAHDDGLVTLNLLLLLCVSFMPIPTAFYGDYPNFRTPMVFYAASLALVGLMHYALLRYVIRHPNLLRANAALEEIELTSRRSLLIPVVCGVASLLSFVGLWLAGLSLLLIPVLLRIFTRIARRKKEEPVPLEKA